MLILCVYSGSWSYKCFNSYYDDDDRRRPTTKEYYSASDAPHSVLELVLADLSGRY